MAIVNTIPKAYFDRFIPRHRDGFSSAQIRNNYLALASGDLLPFRAISSVVLETHDVGTDVAAAALYSGTGVTVTKEVTNQYQGTACIKATVDATGNRQILRAALTTVLDLSSFVTLGVYTRCNTTSSAIQYVLRDASGNESYWNITTNASANTWEQAALTLASPDANNGTPAVLTNIQQYGYKGLDASIVYLFDEVQAHVWAMKIWIDSSHVGGYFYPVYNGADRIKWDGGFTPTITAPVTNPRIDLISYNPDPGSGETYITVTAGSETATPGYANIPATPTGHIPLYAVYLRTTATKIVEYHLSDLYTSDGYIYADLRVLYGGGGGGATATNGTFTNGSLSASVLTITHNLALSAPYSIIVAIFDNNNKQIIPDNITGSTNSVAIDLTSYGTLTGTWGYSYVG